MFSWWGGEGDGFSLLISRPGDCERQHLARLVVEMIAHCRSIARPLPPPACG